MGMLDSAFIRYQSRGLHIYIISKEVCTWVVCKQPAAFPGDPSPHFSQNVCVSGRIKPDQAVIPEVKGVLRVIQVLGQRRKTIHPQEAGTELHLLCDRCSVKSSAFHVPVCISGSDTKEQGFQELSTRLRETIKLRRNLSKRIRKHEKLEGSQGSRETGP